MSFAMSTEELREAREMHLALYAAEAKTHEVPVHFAELEPRKKLVHVLRAEMKTLDRALHEMQAREALDAAYAAEDKTLAVPFEELGPDDKYVRLLKAEVNLLHLSLHAEYKKTSLHEMQNV